MFRLLTHPRFRKITSGIYLLAVVLSAFGAFHAHRLAAKAPAPFHELHDASCDYHAKPPVHLSDHCAACQFLAATGQLQSFSNPIIAQTGISFFTASYSILRPVHADHYLRGPPRFLS